MYYYYYTYIYIKSSCICHTSDTVKVCFSYIRLVQGTHLKNKSMEPLQHFSYPPFLSLSLYVCVIAYKHIYICTVMQVQKRHFMTCQCFFIVRSNTSSPATVGSNIVEIPLSFDILHTHIYIYININII